MYERLLKNAEEKGADISHCGYKMVFPSRIDYYYKTGKTVVEKGSEGLRDLVSGAFVEPGLVNKLYRRELFEGLSDWMDRSIKNTEDLMMNYYLFRGASVCVYEDLFPYHYIVRKNSAANSKMNENKLLDPLRVVKRLMDENDEDSILRDLLLEKLARMLVGLSSMSCKDDPLLLKPAQKQARRELSEKLSVILKSGIPKKVKIMALWAAVWPWSYGFVHRAYARASGIDKKYSLE